MNARLRLMGALLACMALLAAACGGEVTDDAGVGSDVAAEDSQGHTAAAETAEPTDSSSDDMSGDSDEGSEPGADADSSDDMDSAGTDDTDEASTTETETGTDSDSDADEATEGETSEGEAEMSEPEPNIYDDPRDGVFDEFQATMDRGDHPFMQLDAFCHTHEPATNRVATDPGIEADSISLVHLRQKLEDLSQIGFSVPVGDVAEMYDTFVNVVNEQCGGVRGRMLETHLIEIDVLGDAVDEGRNAACIEGTEDLNGVILMDSSGFAGSANLCIAEEHETAFITASGQSGEFMRRGEGRLITVSPTLEEMVEFLALDLAASGALDGKTLGVAIPDTPGNYEAVQVGLVETLANQGIEMAVVDVIGCSGGVVCADGVIESVQRMRDNGVDVFFNVLNVVSAPGYILEMSNQGYEPGDVQFYASDFNAQAGELVSSKIVAFGGEAAGNLYNGALIIDDADTGAYRLEGYEPRVFNEMCNDTYGANSASGANHESEDRATGSSAYGMVATVCVILRTALRAIYDAGDNPTRADIYAALASLGAVDSNEMIPYSLTPGKSAMPDAIHTLLFEYPCTKPAPFGAENICVYPIDEYRLAPR